MDSKSEQLVSLGILDWHSWSDTPSKLPRKPGIYVFRLREKFHRLRGKTDILYIGATETNLRQRIRQYIKPGVSQETNKRMNDLLYKRTYRNKVQVASCGCPKEKVKKLENDLLDQFDKLHDELPPWNRSK